MSYYFQTGNRISITPDSANITNHLECGNYVVKHDMMSGYYLEKTDGFTLPPKIYGDCLKNTDRILNTFESRGKNTGVLLVGEKGSGKTLLMRNISNNSNLPTIIVNSSFTGDEFYKFLSDITQPVIVLFDEFEKVYDSDDQEKILTLLDGTYQSNKLFIITSNDKWRLDSNMKNRPGRLYYMLEYEGLDENFIREYCQDNLKNLSSIEQVVEVAAIFSKFNFDMLTALVEEMNRYDESAEEAVKLLNIKPEYGANEKYRISGQIGNHMIPAKAFYRREINILPSMNEFSTMIYCCYKTDDSYDCVELENAIGGESDLAVIAKNLDMGNIVFGYKNEEWNDDEYETTSLSIELTPDDIVQYRGKSVFYVLDGGGHFTLTRSK